MAVNPQLRHAATLAELAADAAKAIAQGKTPSDYTLAMIQKVAAALCGCDPSEHYADLIAEFDAADEAERQRDADEVRRGDALSFKSMVGWQ